MPTLTREELWKELKAGKVGPLYLLFGPEDYLRDAAARRIADTALKDAPLREFNESSFSLATADVQHAIAAAEQMPMMGGRRVVHITDFSRKPPRPALREEDAEALERYVTRPAETSVVLFVADSLDKRLKLSKTLLDVCASVEFAELKDAELAAWARDRLGRLRLTFSGLMRRDAMVLEACREVGIPVCVTIAGGYGRDVRDTVAVHLNTVRVLAQFA